MSHQGVDGLAFCTSSILGSCNRSGCTRESTKNQPGNHWSWVRIGRLSWPNSQQAID